VSTDKELLQETHDAVIAIETRLDVWCPIVTDDIAALKDTVNGNGRTGLKTIVDRHAWWFRGMWAVALLVGGLVAKAIHEVIH
jgi:hypothetical protein